MLAPMSESQFCDKGKSLATLALEFVKSDAKPPPKDLRPTGHERETPMGMIEAALVGGY